MYELILTGKITPKARPRFASGHAYMPAKYRIWKKGAIESFSRQWGDRETLESARLIITIGAIGQRGDLDNIAGAILDALVQAKVLEDDRISCIPEISIKFMPHKSGLTLILLN